MFIHNKETCACTAQFVYENKIKSKNKILYGEKFNTIFMITVHFALILYKSATWIFLSICFTHLFFFVAILQISNSYYRNT